MELRSMQEWHFGGADCSPDRYRRSRKALRAFTSPLGGAVEKGVVYGTGAWGVGDIKGSASMGQAHEMGRAV